MRENRNKLACAYVVVGDAKRQVKADSVPEYREFLAGREVAGVGDSLAAEGRSSGIHLAAYALPGNCRLCAK